MSILMDALKQQSSPQLASHDSAAFWRKLALALALVVALLSGALLAYWLQPAPVQLSPLTAVTAEPAKPADILAVLQQPQQQTLQPEPTPATQPSAAVAKPQEKLAPTKPMATVTVPDSSIAANSAAQATEQAAVESEPATEMAVSEELRDKFSQALKATAHNSNNSAVRSHDAPAQDISTLDATILRQIPPLRFDAHVYATSATQRWVKVNGKTLQEGQWVTADIRIREITQQYVLLQLGTQLFSMSALSEWPAS